MEKAEYFLSISTVFTPYFYGSKTWYGQHAVPKSSMVCSLSSACSWFTLLRISMFSDRRSAMSIFLAGATWPSMNMEFHQVWAFHDHLSDAGFIISFHLCQR